MLARMPDRPPPRAAVVAVMKARRALLAAADRLLPAQFALFDKTIGVGRTHVLGTLAELGVADLLAAGPKTAAGLPPHWDGEADTPPRVLGGGAVEGRGKLDRRGRFKLTRLAEPLRSDSGHSL